jgi:hypothetical protein
MGLLFIMPSFELKVMQKVSMWQKAVFDVEADTLDQAVDTLKKMESLTSIIIDSDEDWPEVEDVGDTLEELIPEDNDGQSTFEVYQGDNLLFKNGK